MQNILYNNEISFIENVRYDEMKRDRQKREKAVTKIIMNNKRKEKK